MPSRVTTQPCGVPAAPLQHLGPSSLQTSASLHDTRWHTSEGADQAETLPLASSRLLLPGGQRGRWGAPGKPCGPAVRPGQRPASPRLLPRPPCPGTALRPSPPGPAKHRADPPDPAGNSRAPTTLRLKALALPRVQSDTSCGAGRVVGLILGALGQGVCGDAGLPES